jgi:hypothetical protein
MAVSPSSLPYLKGTTRGKNSSGGISSTGLGGAAPPRRSALELLPSVWGLLGVAAPGRRCAAAAAASEQCWLPAPPPQLLPPRLLPPLQLLPPAPLLLCPLPPAVVMMSGTSHRLGLPGDSPAVARCW